MRPEAYTGLAQILDALRGDLSEEEEQHLALLVAAIVAAARQRGGVVESAASRPMEHLHCYAQTQHDPSHLVNEE